MIITVSLTNASLLKWPIPKRCLGHSAAARGGCAAKEEASVGRMEANRDRLPVRLPSDGDPSHLAVAWSWASDLRNDELLTLADHGIFRISVQRA